jgi:hypothetical protein
MIARTQITLDPETERRARERAVVWYAAADTRLLP